jgi:hypothetical protein
MFYDTLVVTTDAFFGVKKMKTKTIFFVTNFLPGAEYMNMLVVGGMWGWIIGIDVRGGGGGTARPPEIPMGEKVDVVLKSISDCETDLSVHYYNFFVGRQKNRWPKFLQTIFIGLILALAHSWTDRNWTNNDLNWRKVKLVFSFSFIRLLLLIPVSFSKVDREIALTHTDQWTWWTWSCRWVSITLTLIRCHSHFKRKKKIFVFVLFICLFVYLFSYVVVFFMTWRVQLTRQQITTTVETR